MREKKRLVSIFVRYLVLLIIALPNLAIFYIIFTPLTVYPSYYLINLIFPSELSGNFIINSYGIIELIEACIAGSAYYLLLLLNLTTPSISFKERISSILFSFITFLVANILRIFLFSLLFFAGFEYFNTTHLIVWYGASTLLVFLIWIAEVKLFKIEEIPVYGDIRSIKKAIMG